MTTTRTALPLPTITDVLRDLGAGDPAGLVIRSRSRVLSSHGMPDGIPYDDQAHLAQLTARNREARIGQAVCAVILIAALIYISLWLGPEVLLP